MPPLRTSLIVPLLLFSGCAALHQEPPGGSAESRQAIPPRWTQDYAERIGRPLLIAQRWEEAGEVYGTSYTTHGPFEGDDQDVISLWKEVRSVWGIHGDRPQAEQDRFRFHLTNFMFLHASLPYYLWEQIEGSYDFADLEMLAEEYPTWAAGLPERKSAQALDFSHIDLLQRIAGLPEDHEHIEAEMDRIFDALRENPESIPAILAFLLYLESVGDETAAIDIGREVLTGRIGRLTLARWAISFYDEDDPPLAEILWQAVDVAPSQEERALFLGWIALCLPRAERIPSVRRLFESYPDTRAGKAAGGELFWSILDQEGPEEALAEVRRLQDTGLRGREAIDSALVLIGKNLLESDELERAESIFRDVAGGHGEWSRPVSDAMFYLSMIHEKRGEKEEQFRWLEAAVGGSPFNPNAAACLAEVYEKQGRWTDAMIAWEKWYPEDYMCGNAMDSDLQERVARIARLKAAAGEAAAASKMLVEYILKPTYPADLGGGEDVRLALYHLYVDAGQVEDLRSIMREIVEASPPKEDGPVPGSGAEPPRSRRRPNLNSIHQMLAVYELYERRDVKELLAVCRNPRNYPERVYWERRPYVIRREAVEALARCGKEVTEPLRVAAAERGAGLKWFLEALGRIPGPESLGALENLMGEGPPMEGWSERGSGGYHRYSPGDWLELMGKSLAMHGPDGRVFLEKLARDEESQMRYAARHWLERLEAGWTAPMIRPPVTPGSLPKRIEIRRAP